MAYTPELSYESSCTLRRLAWALNMPMTKAIEEVFNYLPKIVDRKKVCEGCRDKTMGDLLQIHKVILFKGKIFYPLGSRLD